MTISADHTAREHASPLPACFVLVVSGAVWSAEIVIGQSFCCHYSFPVSACSRFRIQQPEEPWRSCPVLAIMEDEL